MQCKRCGRILKNKESIDRGYGTGCFKKIHEETEQIITLEDFNI